MSERGSRVSGFAGGGLQEAVREVRVAAADREDVVVEMRDAERLRLELLAQELAPIIAEVPDDDTRFDFTLSSGLRPRFWIDAVSHVSMGRDRRTYRFLHDTRLGRTVLAESADLAPVVRQVTRYVAERIVERQRMMEGEVIRLAPDRGAEDALHPATRAIPRDWSMLLGGLMLIGAGAICGIALSLALLWAWGALAF